MKTAILSLLAAAGICVPALAVTQQAYIHGNSPEAVRRIAADGRLDVLRIDKRLALECLADAKVFDEYQGNGFRVEIRYADAEAHYRQLKQSQLRYDFGPFYTYAEANARMDSLHLLYPAFVAAKESIGVSRQGRVIYACEVTNAPAGKPGSLTTGQTHAREPFGCNMSVELARWLCQHYGTDSMARFLVDNRRIRFIPVVNPDGSIFNADSSTTGMWRKNRRINGDGTFGVDLNRNYPFAWGWDNSGSSPTSSSETYRGPSAGSEPEVQAVMSYMVASGDIRTALNYHTYTGLWIYPLGYINQETPDSLAARDLAAECVAINSYETGTAATLLYAVNGVSDDWMYCSDTTKPRCLAMTPEVGTEGFYMPDSLEAQIDINRLPNLYMIAAAGNYLDAKSRLVSGGNGDLALDPGETADLAVGVKNLAVFDTARGIEAWLSSADPYVTINSAAATYGDFAQRQLKSNAGQPFSVTLSADCPVGYAVPFVITFTGDSGYASSDTFSVIAGVGDLRYLPTPDNAAGTPVYYAVEDSDGVARAPVYNWTEIRGLGTQLTGLSADDAAAVVSLPFTFNWYGSPYTALRMCSNGWVAFGTNTSTAYSNTAIPTSTFSNGCIFPLWDDLNGSSTAAPNAWAGYYHDAANGRFIVEWDSLVFFGTSTRVKFQVLFYDSTASHPYCDVVVQYNMLSNATSASVGFQQNSTVGCQQLYNGTYATTMVSPLTGGRAVRITRSPEPLGVAGRPAAAGLPLTYQLGQAYPNPFKQSTMINYQIPKSEMIDLAVYNIAGQKVRTLVRGPRPAGSHTVTWDGRDEAGRAVSAGVYLYRLTAGEFRASAKTIFLR